MLHAIVGPMFSGKSTEVVARINRYHLARRTVLACKPETDTRQEGIHSHDGLHADALVIAANGSNLTELTDRPFVDVFVIDEVQFMPRAIVPILNRLALDVDVVVAGLDLDAFGIPFPVTAELLAIADTVDKRKAVCMECGGEAGRTQRLDGGGCPVTSGETVVVGGSETYTARCTTCFVMA